MTRFFVDSNVFLYALGAEHRYREPCRRLIEHADAGRLRPEASVELVQEVLWVRARRLDDRRQALQDARDVAELCVLHPLEARDLEAAMALYQNHATVTPRDAVHAATAIERGVGRIVSADRHLDAIPGLRRIDPVDIATVDGLI
ncbi:MAG: type II toxin-antitoxin system VapC family toxin [Actinomycetota bacterium]|nr:type II toxin-antitoxin system VapC family toxin [Actinomycetota bacterium]